MSLAAALAAASHHSAQQYGAPRGQKLATRLLPGMRPARLSEVLPQVGLQRHTVEQRFVHTLYVQILDALVPQKVEQLVDFFKDLDSHVPVQVIEVPKISQDIIPQRSVDFVPQMAEQLVEVPTLLSVAVLQQRTAVQLASIPVPRGRGQGFLPVQRSTAISSSGKRISERIVEQIVNISPPGVGLGQGSSSSAGPADEDFTGFFRTFLRGKKVRVPPRVRVRSCPGRSAHGLRRLMVLVIAGLLVVSLSCLTRGVAASSSPVRRPSSVMRRLVGSVSPSRGRHFAADASVTFSVRTGPDGFMEAYDIEVVGRG